MNPGFTLPSNAPEMCAYALAAYAYPKDLDVGAMKDRLDPILSHLGYGELSVIWGALAPVSALKADRTSPWNVALVVVAYKVDSNEYVVIVRGTNPLSWESWLYEDFDVQDKVPWLPGEDPLAAPMGAVSKATDTAFRVHTSLRDNEESLLAFLEREAEINPPARISFTGHSLGGCIAPVLALKLAENGRVSRDRLGVYAYAGPTPGDGDFADHMTQTFKDFRSVAFVRDVLDIVPHAWDVHDLNSLKSLYPDHRITAEVLALLWFVQGLVHKNDYVHAFPGFVNLIPLGNAEAISLFSDFGSFAKANERFLDSNLWTKIKRGLEELNIEVPGPKDSSLLDTVAWFLTALLMHVYPYFQFCGAKAQATLLSEVLKPLYFGGLFLPPSTEP